jgi:hypothetical protein
VRIVEWTWDAMALCCACSGHSRAQAAGDVNEATDGGRGNWDSGEGTLKAHEHLLEACGGWLAAGPARPPKSKNQCAPPTNGRA